jgi:putative transcriptional regulator
MKNRLRVLRAEQKWSQAELAERVGVSRNSINAVENGKFDPSLPLAFRIADAFGLAIEQVFLREDAPAAFPVRRPTRGQEPEDVRRK